VGVVGSAVCGGLYNTGCVVWVFCGGEGGLGGGGVV